MKGRKSIEAFLNDMILLFRSICGLICLGYHACSRKPLGLSDGSMVRPLGAETRLKEDRDALSNTYEQESMVSSLKPGDCYRVTQDRR